MAIEKVLVIDDEELIRNFIIRTLEKNQFEVMTAENGKAAISLIRENAFDLVFTDMKMPDLTGIEVLKKVKQISPQAIVVVITAYGSVENAVEAMRYGAFNYLIKPFSEETIKAVIDKANDHQKLLHENHFLREEVTRKGNSAFRVIAESPVMKSVLKDAARVAKSNASVFISGESGTGKEVIAQEIHNQSPRAGRPFVKVNCAAIPETLIESEFFGHEKGAFTGANQKRIGRFELANCGTLLLDEITEIPLALQAKLLRAIQEKEFERVGGTKPVKVDVRIISTSNRDIAKAIDENILREDLYYRLNVVPIYLPPLRERPEDVVPLAKYFLKRLCQENHKMINRLTDEALERLLAYTWPGNVRELANIMERAVVMNTTLAIEPMDLALDFNKKANAKRAKAPAQNALPIGVSLRELEKRLIIETLQVHNNNREKTAKVLGISTKTLRNKLNAYDTNLD